MREGQRHDVSRSNPAALASLANYQFALGNFFSLGGAVPNGGYFIFQFTLWSISTSNGLNAFSRLRLVLTAHVARTVVHDSRNIQEIEILLGGRKTRSNGDRDNAAPARSQYYKLSESP
jgi:hypothetical protein